MRRFYEVKATGLGWNKADDEGCVEFLMRRAYETGHEDAVNQRATHGPHDTQTEARGVEGFDSWWGASKYCQVSLGQHRQLARDAWDAAAPSGVRVDDAMVERAMRAFMETHRPELEHSIRAALTAALAGKEGA
jgi:hypothetical protein